MATLKYRKSDGTYGVIPVLQGPEGLGIKSVAQTTTSTAAGGTNVWTMTLNDGSAHTFNVMNGTKGDKGDKGDTGASMSVAVDTSSTNVPVAGVNTSDTTQLKYNTNVYLNCSTGVLMGAAWNDYAEYRETKEALKAGLVVYETGNDKLEITDKRLMPGCSITSDTFGFAIGKTDKAQTPVAVCGRVLAYPNESIDSYSPGDAVCSGPNGKVSKMTREEIKEYPDCIIGYVSSIPTYEVWEPNNTVIDGRIWIKVK